MGEVNETFRSAFTDRGFSTSEEGFVLRTAAFQGMVRPDPEFEPADESITEPVSYTVSVSVPSLQAATEESVGSIVEEDWFETLARRLREANKATRHRVEFTAVAVELQSSDVSITYEFERSDPVTGAAIAKTLIEYVEGTYVEGIIPGYTYEPPVSDLLAGASHDGNSGTPL